MCGITLTASRAKSGFAKAKGYKAISFSKWLSTGVIVNTAAGVVAIPAAMDIYRFQVKNTADNFIQTATKDLVTMTSDKVGAGTFALMYCDRIKNIADAQALLDGVWNVFFEGNDLSIIVAGSANGGDIVTVVESSDAQGFLFTLTTTEPEFAHVLTGAGITAYNAAIEAIA
jgi:hypothetical protein